MSNKVKIWPNHFTLKDCQRSPNALFIFGDNVSKVGHAGQAIIRDQTNAYGIPTCCAPGVAFTDKNFQWNCNSIDLSISKILKKAKNYDFIYFPEGGIGTGLAMLHTRAPTTYKYLNQRMLEEFGVINGPQSIISKDLL